MSSVTHRFIRNPLIVAVVLLDGAWWLHAPTASYGPCHVVGFNYTNRGVCNFVVDCFGAGSVHAPPVRLVAAVQSAAWQCRVTRRPGTSRSRTT